LSRFPFLNKDSTQEQILVLKWTLRRQSIVTRCVFWRVPQKIVSSILRWSKKTSKYDIKYNNNKYIWDVLQLNARMASVLQNRRQCKSTCPADSVPCQGLFTPAEYYCPRQKLHEEWEVGRRIHTTNVPKKLMKEATLMLVVSHQKFPQKVTNNSLTIKQT
jgi:hypothetical protein